MALEDLSIITLLEMLATATISAIILDTFLWYIYMPAVKRMAETFERKDKHKRSLIKKEDLELQRKDVSYMYRLAAKNKTMAKKFLNRCMDYETVINELHVMSDQNDSQLLNRCKNMIYKYQKVPEIISYHLQAYENYLNQLSRLLDQAEDCWQCVSINYQVPENASESKIKHFQNYMKDGSIITYLGHLTQQYMLVTNS